MLPEIDRILHDFLFNRQVTQYEMLFKVRSKADITQLNLPQ